MPIAKIHSRALLGIDAPAVTVEAHVAPGLPAFTLVGLPETAVRESRDRVRAAILSSGFEFPPRRLTVNLAPADLPKESARFDLAIALAILAATGQLPASASERLRQVECLGELSLDGALRPIRGTLSAARAARDAGRELLLPAEGRAEAELIPRVAGRALSHLAEAVGYLAGEQNPDCLRHRPAPPSDPAIDGDLADVRGQPRAKRALAIAAAGGHNLLLIGPPGAGKSMLAQRLAGILPPLTENESLAVAEVAAVSPNGFDPTRFGRRPFRAPHHSASAVALIGGGSQPGPGEISLAHHGTLFLDELPEFDRRVLEALREPMEVGSVMISRAARQATFPADFQLIAAMNPSPQGTEVHSRAAQRYRAKVSGPLLDRIDIHLEIPRVPAAELDRPAEPGEDSATIRERVINARRCMLKRQGVVNAQLDARGVADQVPLAKAERDMLNQAIEKLQLSGRARERILKLARSIADYDERTAIDRSVLAEAIGYRNLDRLFAGS
ncbi:MULTISPECIES: YifB family Mg chelatase-like AAA ATPase [unclassified Guyparkeria]|uniref:YifB family Mg chelatase-like AAA ATPase n=1 Tax=unclassified Guyparkeria TaxID=2626246 RepID=UPI0007333EC6|nr:MULTISPECIES: YifB family Mg chelatase-like AAA ATPase [unclassified Guyparkeria]KTG17029.1 ATP-dependent protease [Guyparkeria sp. XI15]OAE86063.1 ATP-dependent protease [Guyparkeria sp. WRN-7]